MSGRGQYSGRVEVLVGTVWGTVCHRDWDDVDATLVCRQLGFNLGGTAYYSAYFGQGQGPIWLDYVNCNGDETSIFDCRYSALGSSTCRHSGDAGVVCSGSVSFNYLMTKSYI